jgi:C-5 cytosine-specific DNA methylase
MKPLAIDLFCGLGGWTEGLLAEGWDVIGFDIERRPYPAQLVLQDVITLHGSQFKDAALIVASPPCQAYSYRAMPWKRAKALPPPDNSLFEACFRIQREACEAAGRYIPLIVENVKGACKWVGGARWHYGSFYLWGDVPALMPYAVGRKGLAPIGTDKAAGTGSASWFFGTRADPRDMRRNEDGEWTRFGIKGSSDQLGGARHAWFDGGLTKFGSRREARKAASAEIAKIPFPLARHIARVFKP